MELVFDPYTGKMVDPQTGLPMGLPPGYAPPGRVNVFEQMLNGTGIPERVNALNQTFNPVNALGDAGNAAEVMLAPETSGWGRVAAAGQMLSGMSGAVAPMVAAAKLGTPAAQAIEDAMLGFAPAGNAFLADEFGGIKLYHGSPHDFDKFSMDNIGTGEGAQAYGHGLYFAENEGVAKGYRDTLSKSGTDGARRRLSAAGGDVDAAIAAAKDKAAKYRAGGADNYASAVEEDLRFLEKFKQTGEWSGGRLYEVEVNAKPEDFLDWDAPLNAQPQKVRDALGSGEETAASKLKRAYNNPMFGGDIVGKDTAGPDEVSRALAAKGVPGIKYLDAGSRSAGDGSRNYVVFDENLISIVRKYGIAGAAAMLGMSQADIQTAMGGQSQ